MKNKIHEVRTIAAQGDVLLRRVDRLPEGAKLVKRRKGAPIVVAHSETNHHHVIEADGVIQYESPNPLVCYLQLDGIDHADLIHRRPWDTHDTLRLVGNPTSKVVFEARRQREFIPEGFRRVED